MQVVVWLLLGEQETSSVGVQRTGLNRQPVGGIGRLAFAVKVLAHVVGYVGPGRLIVPCLRSLRKWSDQDMPPLGTRSDLCAVEAVV